MRAFDLPPGRVAVAHVEARLFAFSDECTHAGCSLSEGTFDDRQATVECACHGSVLDVETGEPIDGPAQDDVAVHQAPWWTAGSRSRTCRSARSPAGSKTCLRG